MSRPGYGEEPLIHSAITDVLPEDHPLAHENTGCDKPGCSELLHYCINENMQTWVEAHNGNYCLPCFAALDDAEGIIGWSGSRDQA